MNRFEAERRFAERMKNNYPPGTRLVLLQMGDDPRPVEPNTRCTVAVVDDMGTLHCDFDNGRQLGLVPGEDSSGGGRNRLAITKAGNSHLRRLLVESSQSYSRGTIGFKSKELKKRQEGNPPEVVAYADRANERLRRRYYRMTLKNGAKRNVAIVAVARELACFIWGIMTDEIA